MEHTFEQRQKLLEELQLAYDECIKCGEDLDDDSAITISPREAEIIIDIMKTWSL